MNILNTVYSSKKRLFQLFFSASKTVEEQFLLKHFTSEMFDEIRIFIPFLTENDATKILSCSDSKQLLYTTAESIGRIRGEEAMSQEIKTTIAHVVTGQLCVLTTPKKK